MEEMERVKFLGRRTFRAFSYDGDAWCACLVFAKVEQGVIKPMTVDYTFGSVREKIKERIGEGCVNPIPWVADIDEENVLLVVYECSPAKLEPKYEKLLLRFIGPPPIPGIRFKTNE